MAHRVEAIDLLSPSPGTRRNVLVHRFGQPGGRPKVYLQAGLHANEVPGIVILNSLRDRLAALNSAGLVRGEVVLVPFANPIGLNDTVLGVHVGRYGIDTGSNFNRGFPDLGPPVAAALENTLQAASDPATAIRGAMIAEIDRRPPRTELESLRLALLRLAIDADIVFDLHTEEDALFAAVLAPWVLPHAAGLVADIHPELVLYADYPPLFDAACSRPWHFLRQHFAGRVEIPQACLSATLELRGVASVQAAQVARDTDGLVMALRRAGALAGDPGQPPALPSPTRFEGVEFVRADRAGIVVYRVSLGEHVTAGQVLAEIVDPTCTAAGSSRSEVVSAIEGVVFARRHTLLVRPDDVVAKVAGPVPLSDPKHY